MLKSWPPNQNKGSAVSDRATMVSFKKSYTFIVGVVNECHMLPLPPKATFDLSIDQACLDIGPSEESIKESWPESNS